MQEIPLRKKFTNLLNLALMENHVYEKVVRAMKTSKAK